MGNIARNYDFRKVNMRTLLYIANHRLPTEKAYGIQIAKMCEAFAAQGLEAELVVPTRRSFIREDFFDYYGVKRNFRVTELFSPDFYWPGKLDYLAFWIKNIISAFALARYAAKQKPDFIYSRDELPLYFLSFFKKNLIFEAHKFSKARKIFYKNFKRKNLRVIAISQNLKNEFVKFGFKPENILVAHDGVDLKDFDIETTKEEAKKKFNLPQNKILLGYVGQLRTMGMEKGIDLAIKSLKLLPEDVNLVLVGGGKEDIDFYRELTIREDLKDKVIFTGQIKHSLIPFYLKSFDVLLMPFPRIHHYEFYMSPLKLFEYMASRRPIVVSDLPSIREILDDQTAVFFESDNPEQLAGSIKKVIQDDDLAETISTKAFEKVQNYTWQKRAEKILEFIK